MTIAKLKKNKALSKFKDSIDAYLKEIGRVPLLNADEEIIFGKQVQRYMSCLEKKKELEQESGIILDHQDWAKALSISEEELKQILRRGKQAKNKMIQANLRLVVSVAKKYQNRGLDLLDLIQEGSLGLERGVEKFDPSKGYKFSTYAFWWIRQAMTRSIATQARTIRLPIHIIDKLNKIRKTRRELSLKLGRTVTTAEIAEELEITLEEIREYLRKAQEPISLNLQLGNEKDSELLELVEDKSLSSQTKLSQNMLKEELYKILEELNPKEREVIVLRFGLEDGEEWTLGAIGEKLKLSRERVRQLYNRALRILKSKNIGVLRDFLAG